MQNRPLWFPEQESAHLFGEPWGRAQAFRHQLPEGFSEPGHARFSESNGPILVLGLDHSESPWLHQNVDIFEFSHPVLEWAQINQPHRANVWDLAERRPGQNRYNLIVVGRALLDHYPGLRQLAKSACRPGGRILWPPGYPIPAVTAGFIPINRETWQRQRIRILLVAPSLVQGGADKALVDLAQTLDPEHFEVSLVTTEPSANPWLLLVKNVVQEHWDLGSLVDDNPTRVRVLVDFIRRRGIDLVYLMHSKVGFDALPQIKATTLAKVAVQFHLEEPGGGWIRYATSQYQNLIDRYIVITAHLKRYITENFYVEPHKVSVIPLGVRSMPSTSPLPPSNHLTVLVPARLHAQKAPHRFIAIARELRRRELPVTIHIVGSGPLASSLQEGISQHHLTDYLVLEGVVPPDQMSLWYQQAHVVMLASDYEGLPLAFIEAMAHGRPVITSAVGAVEELVDSGVGFLIDPPDQIMGYVDALAELVRDRSLLMTLGRESAARIANSWQWDDTLLGYQALFHQLVSS